MPVLGYGQVSSIAPDTISSGWKGIVQTLRQTGQEIAANVEKIQTNKQLAAFTQEASSLSPQSPDYMPQLIGLAGKYPLVGASPQGRMALGMAEMANKNFLAQEEGAKDFNRSMALEGYRNRNALGRIRLEDSLKDDGFLNTANGVMDKRTRSIIPGTGPVPKERAPMRPIPVPGRGLMDFDTRTIIPGTEPLAKPAPSAAPMSDYQRTMANLKLMDDEIDNLTMDLRSETNEDRKRDIQARLDQKRIARDRFEIAVPSIAPPALGGLGAPQIPVDPMDQGGVVPSLQALPQPQTTRQASPIQPAPQFVPGKVYRDKAGNRRVFTGDSWQPAP